MKTIQMHKKHKQGPMVLSGIVTMVMLLCLSHTARAQQDSQFTQYMYNTETINPAYAGSRGVLSLTSLYRTQWVGLDGAPKTLNFTANTPLGDEQKVGVGLTFTQDKIGPSDKSTIAADFSYTIPFNNDVRLAFGIKGGINLLNIDYSVLNIHNPNDALQQHNIDNKLKPIIGAGLYLHNNRTWYAGLSVPNILETTHYDDATVSNASEKAHLYAIGGYVFTLNPNIKFKPAVLGKFVMGAPAAIDVSANFLFSERFTLGAAYRLDAAVSALAGFQISEKLMIGYAYDYSTTELQNYSSGSHEIFLRFELGSPKTKRFLTPRFF
ncbi:type IX secretion system membrane protein PorP/SprF [Galbibacter sp. EGI 63066]|uniref:PorP/SprF family type IX secretion system membrane protein n=1 Tax=Galbibacter sp. EGI 63066 TaxID=2993559 RepID=UPI0022488274|nr:type IX secretion system membrane protein PorP/SprF [Galbibacter sp. EGI 63066]MCX2679833.1 type IX secretion system membrane protein PorP/SprF [Galbibacter sp. EGI 63066]